MSFAWKGFHSFGGGFSPSFGPSLTGGVTPIGLWDASTSTLAQLAALVSHSRTSGAMLFDSTGKLTYAPNNLLTQSNTFSNAAWTKVSATITTGVLDRSGGTSASTLTATGAFANLYASATTSSSHNVIQSIWIRRRTGTGKIWMKIASSGALFEITGQVTSGWTQVSISGAANASSTPNFLQLDTSGDAVDISEAGVSAVTYETSPRTADQVITTSSAYYGPRIDYAPNTLAVKGLLIEEARTNLVVNSNQFVSWTISGGSSVATNSNTQIDGTTNGNTFSLVAGVSGHQIYKSYTGTAVAYTNSVYAKAGTSSWLGMWFVSTAQADGAFFNLSNGTIGTVAAGTTAAIQSIGNGWYRCSITKTLTAATYYNGLEVHTADNQAYNFNAAGTESLYLFGAQGELGSFPTSYIPTAAASVTRAADQVAGAGVLLSTLQGSAWTFIMEASSNQPTAAAAGYMALNGGYTLRKQSGTTVQAYNNSASIYATLGSGSFATGARLGIAVSASGRSIAANGSAASSDANAALVPGPVTSAMLGGEGGVIDLNGWVKSFAVYNQRLPDATLQSKSVVNAAY